MLRTANQLILSGIALGLLAGFLNAEPIRTFVNEKDEKKFRITDNEELHRLYLKGIHQAFSWDYEASRKTFEELIEKDPDNPAGDYFMGALTLNTIQYLDPQDTGDMEKFLYKSLETAIKKADAILKKRPKDFQAIFWKGVSRGFRGILRLQKGQFLSAASDARVAKGLMDEAIKLKPDFYDAYLGVGMYQYFMGALPAVVKILKMFLFVPGGSKDKGLEYITLAARKATYSNTYGIVVLAGIYRNFDPDFDKALELENRLRNLYPSHPWYALERGSLFVYSMKDFNRGEEVYREIVERCKKGERNFSGEISFIARYRFAKTKYLNLKPLEAMADLEALLKENPEEPREALSATHLLMGEIHLKLGNSEKAKEHLQKVMALPDSKTYRHERMDNRVIIPVQLGLHSMAKRLLEQPALKNSAETFRLTTGGYAELRKGNAERAKKNFEAALTVWKGYDLAILGLSEALVKLEEFEGAQVQYKRIATMNHSQPAWALTEACLRYGLLLDRAGRRDAAVAHYLKAARMKTGNHFHRKLASQLAKKKDLWKDTDWPGL